MRRKPSSDYYSTSRLVYSLLFNRGIQLVYCCYSFTIQLTTNDTPSAMTSLFLRKVAANTGQRYHPAAVYRRSNTLLQAKCAVAATATTTPTPTPSTLHHYTAVRSFFFFHEKKNNRIKDIRVNENSIGAKIKPGDLVDKYYPKTKNTRTLPVELAHGYFWMVADLSKTNGKPTLSNDYLIPAKNAQPFPDLKAGVKTLDADESVELPQFFLRKNRSLDENAQCTLVAIACRDHGFQMLQSWTKPFQEAFANQERVEIVHLHLTEGWFSSTVLASIIKSSVQNNTPKKDHPNTLLCFRKSLEDFRDSLRIHNVMTGYVFLLDGIGRVRFAGSGEASPEEIEKLIGFAKELTPILGKSISQAKKARGR